MERVWEETNPATADRLREVDENMRGRVDAVAALRGQIQSERSVSPTLSLSLPRTLSLTVTLTLSLTSKAQEDVLQTLRRHEQEARAQPLTPTQP
mmetsp:Transcript_21944/g.67399  ORF Transcript_21944/g.67399 Transcript_21944/m.67399 type:complete len:95 (+) Transcript_21944:2293-2577(+)